jgi:hypothetical protein
MRARRAGRRSSGRRGTPHVDNQLLISIVLAACLIGFYAYYHRSARNGRNAEPRPAIIGKAWVIDGDTIEISGTRIRLEGIDAPESNQTCTDPKGKTWPCG